MARKSAAALAAVPVPGRTRPPTPRGYDYLERRLWNSLVDSLPDRWLDTAAQDLLRRAVTQSAAAERLEALLRKMRKAGLDSPGNPEFQQTIIAHREAAKSAAFLLTALRATPKSRTQSREARVANEKIVPAKPWLVKADGAA
jgi:hypothetical protein